jgi:hypothetical protein
MAGHHATLGRTRPFPLKIEKFPAQTALYYLLGIALKKGFSKLTLRFL